MKAGFKSDTNNVSNKTNLTNPEVNLKSPFHVMPQKGLIEKNSTVKVTPEKPSKSEEEKIVCLQENPRKDRKITLQKHRRDPTFLPTCYRCID